MIRTITMLLAVGTLLAWGAPAKANEAFCQTGRFHTDGNSKAWCETSTPNNTGDAKCKGDYEVTINSQHIVLQHPGYAVDKRGQEDRCVVTWTPPHPNFGPAPKPVSYDFAPYCPLGQTNTLAGQDKCFNGSTTSRPDIQLRNDT